MYNISLNNTFTILRLARKYKKGGKVSELFSDEAKVSGLPCRLVCKTLLLLLKIAQSL
jgi:hypothetical protein